MSAEQTNSVTDSTQSGLPHDPRRLTAWVLDKNHNVTKDEYNLLVCYKHYQLEKTKTTKLRQIHLHFCWAFALFHHGIVITVTFKILHTYYMTFNLQFGKVLSIAFCINFLISNDFLRICFPKTLLWHCL